VKVIERGGGRGRGGGGGDEALPQIDFKHRLSVLVLECLESGLAVEWCA